MNLKELTTSATMWNSNRKREKSWLKSSKETAIIQIPFISDQFTERIRRAIKTSGLRVIIRVRPGLQLRHILKKLKYPRHCTKRNCPISDDNLCFRYNVVYRLKCMLCGEIYIGSTTRNLHDRAIEHSRAARNQPSYSSGMQLHNITGIDTTMLILDWRLQSSVNAEVN